VHWASDLRRQRAEARLAELRKILAADPYNVRAIRAALELARELGRYDEACGLLARLVRLEPDDANLRFELATLLMRLRRWLEALPHLRLVVAREPGNARAWYNLAIAHQTLAHLHDARAAWDRVAELMPENADVYAHRGEVLLDLRAWAPAAADLETALRLEPGSIDTAMNLSLALHKLGRQAEARATLLPLLARHPQHVPLLNRLAGITWALYEADPAAHEAAADEALDYCVRSLAVNANQPDIRALMERAAQGGE
jgi:predicted Zn-dependent protease